MLAVVNDAARECLALVADTSLSGARVACKLDAIITWRGKPAVIVSDNVLFREGDRLSGQQIPEREFVLAA